MRPRRRLTIYWLNLALLLSIAAASAICIKYDGEISQEPAVGSIDGRYHWADAERDILIEIVGGEYTEYEQMGPSIREVTSSGSCSEVGGGISLLDREKNKSRTLELTPRGLRETGADFERELERCNHPSALIERGENPFSVDGVQLGMSRAEVEARWGELSKEWCGWNVYSGQNGGYVDFDRSELVCGVIGSTLYEFARPINFEELLSYGHSSPAYRLYDSSNHRIAGDYEISVFGQGDAGVDYPQYLREFDPFESEEIAGDEVPLITLRYRF